MIELDTAGWGSTTYVANLTCYVPLYTLEPLIVAQFFWMAGTAAAGSTDVGIYDRPGTTLLVHAGAQTNTATSALQFFAVAGGMFQGDAFQNDAFQTAGGFELPAGRYWLALTCDSSSQTYRRVNKGVGILDFLQVRQHASDYSSGLPASATLNTPTSAQLPIYGFTGYAA